MSAPDPAPTRPTSTDRTRRFSRDGARAVDREAIEDWGFPGPLLMENAAAALESVVLAEWAARDPARPESVLIVCGPGNNGGDGWALARRLANRRADDPTFPAVRVVAVGAPRPESDAGLNARLTRRMGVAVVERSDQGASEPPALVVDAVLGTGLDRPAEGEPARAIAAIERWRVGGARVIAADVPSGLDADTGRPAGDGPAVRADVTVSFMGPKAGFDEAGAAAWTGRVVVGDIGVPRAILDRHASA